MWGNEYVKDFNLHRYCCKTATYDEPTDSNLDPVYWKISRAKRVLAKLDSKQINSFQDIFLRGEYETKGKNLPLPRSDLAHEDRIC